MSLEILPGELHRRLRAGERVYLLDVRQEWEHQTARLPSDLVIPLHELPARLDEVKPEPGQLVVTYCHHGVRSLSAAVLLRDAGFAGALSLAGGVDLWSQVIDPAVPRY